MDIDTLKELCLERLTEKQKNAVLMVLDGKTQAEIAKITGCSVQNISCLIKAAIERNSRILARGEKRIAPRKKAVRCQTKGRLGRNYGEYKDKDFTSLTPREKEIMTLKIEGLTYQQIADRVGVQSSCVGALLHRARAKLDGTYHDGLRVTINQRAREARKKSPDKVRKNNKMAYLKNREKRIADMREYNKKYYQQHREEILKRQEEKRAARLEKI